MKRKDGYNEILPQLQATSALSCTSLALATANRSPFLYTFGVCCSKLVSLYWLELARLLIQPTGALFCTGLAFGTTNRCPFLDRLGFWYNQQVPFCVLCTGLAFDTTSRCPFVFCALARLLLTSRCVHGHGSRQTSVRAPGEETFSAQIIQQQRVWFPPSLDINSEILHEVAKRSLQRIQRKWWDAS